MKKNFDWKKIFALPLAPTLLIVAAAIALHVFVFRGGHFGLIAYFSYTLSTYALILVCTGYARLIAWDSRWKAPFILPVIPTMLIIIVGAALLIYIFTADNYGPIAYVAYLLSSYALVLAIVGYIRLFREMSRSKRRVYLEGRHGSIAVQSRFLGGLMSTFLAPFVEAIFTYFSYIMVKTARGVQRGSMGTILLAMLSIIGILVLSIAGPLFFLVGICCVYMWGRPVRGIVLCAIGLVLMVLASQITLHIMSRQQKELAHDIQELRI